MTSLLHRWYGKKTTIVACILILGIITGIGIHGITYGRAGPGGKTVYTVIIRHYGIDPERMERSITIPMEDAVSLIGGVEEIRSTSQLNTSRITLELVRRVDRQNFFLQLRDAVYGVYNRLPDSVQRPEMFSSSGTDRPFFIVAFSQKGKSTRPFHDFIDKEIKPGIEKIPGVGEVETGGEGTREVHIQAGVFRLQNMGLSIPDLASAIRSSYGNVRAAVIEEPSRYVSVNLDGRVPDLESLAHIPIPLPGGGTIPLGEVAEVTYGLKHAESISRIDGEKRTVLYIKSAGTGSPVSISRNIRQELDLFSGNVEYTVVYDFGEELGKSIREVMFSLGISIAATSLFLFLAIRKPGLALLLSLTIPANVAITLGLISLFGMSVDVGILSGIAVGTGLICDSGIVISQAIEKRKDIRGVFEVFPALVASTVTTLIATVPLFFLPGASTAVRQMASAFIILVTVSTATAILFLPPGVPASRTAARETRKAVRRFWNIMRMQLLHPWAGITVMCVLIGITVLSFFFLPLGLAGSMEQPIAFAHLELPGGSSVETVDRELVKIRGYLKDHPGITKVETFARRTNGTASVSFNPASVSKSEVVSLLDSVNDVLGTGFLYVQDEGDGMTEFTVDFIGPDDLYLREVAKGTASYLQGLPWVRQTVLHFKEGDPVWLLDLDYDRMNALGANAAQVSTVLRWGLFGPVTVKWKESTGEMDLRVMGSVSGFDSIEAIRTAGIINRDRQFVPFTALGTFNLVRERGRIYRVNRQRSVSIGVKTNLTSLTEIRENLLAALESRTFLPGHGYRIDPGLEKMRNRYKTLFLSLLLAAVLVYMVLAGQYESLTSPIVMFLVIPISLSFPLALLWITGKPFSLAVIIGLVVVTGLGVNNTILIVDDVLKQKDRCYARGSFPAVRNALRRRTRPLLLTTGSTMLGLIPLIAYRGSGSYLLRELSVTVFAGMAGSAFTSLLVLPSVMMKFPGLTRRLLGDNITIECE